jgi:hypothetical protein
MKSETKKIIDTAELIKSKQLLSDELTALLADIADSTGVNGDIELMITRTKKVFTIDATSIENKLTTKRNNIDSAVDALVAKITING